MNNLQKLRIVIGTVTGSLIGLSIALASPFFGLIAMPYLFLGGLIGGEIAGGGFE